MTNLPFSHQYTILEEAHARHPQRESLAEFRAEKHIIDAETAALEAAGRIITPHAAIAGLFPEKAIKIPWQLTAHLSAKFPPAFSIAFPGPTTAAKGAFEVRDAARALKAEVVLVGPEQEGIGFWAGVRTRRVKPGENWLEGVSVVVQPALIEDHPRHLLTALASGVPVIATAACGLESHRNIIEIPPGDGDMLFQALRLLKEKMYGSEPAGPGRGSEPKTL